MSEAGRPSLSIIMPSFNSAQTLEHSVASVLRQSLRDFELIIVDDGSTDRSLQIAETLATSDRRVSIVRQSNGGVSSARNAGLASAGGKLVTFLDADDVIHPRTYEEALAPFQQDGIDLVLFGMRVVSLLDGRVVRERSTGIVGNWSLHDDHGPFPLFQLLDVGLLMSANNKVYRRSLLTEHRIVFDEASAIMEDFGFVLDYLAHASRVISLPQPYYCYFVKLTKEVLRRRPDVDYVRNFSNLEAKVLRLAETANLANNSEQDLSRLVFKNYILGGDYQLAAARSASDRWRRTRAYFGSPAVVRAAERSDGRSRSERTIRSLASERRFVPLALFLYSRRLRMTLKHKLSIARMRNQTPSMPRILYNTEKTGERKAPKSEPRISVCQELDQT